MHSNFVVNDTNYHEKKMNQSFRQKAIFRSYMTSCFFLTQVSRVTVGFWQEYGCRCKLPRSDSIWKSQAQSVVMSDFYFLLKPNRTKEDNGTILSVNVLALLFGFWPPLSPFMKNINNAPRQLCNNIFCGLTSNKLPQVCMNCALFLLYFSKELQRIS